MIDPAIVNLPPDPHDERSPDHRGIPIHLDRRVADGFLKAGARSALGECVQLS
jgi:hypothetical protein